MQISSTSDFESLPPYNFNFVQMGAGGVVS